MSRDHSEARVLRSELLDAHRDLTRARTQIEQLIASNQDLSSMLASASRQAADLLKVIVAFRRLSEAADRSAAVQALADVAINVLGTEDFVVLACTEFWALTPIAGMGPALDAAQRNPPTLEELQESGGRVVPLYIGKVIAGMLVIRSLLEHREPLNDADEQVLAVLSHFGATAIVASNERRHWTRLPTPPVS